MKTKLIAAFAVALAAVAGVTAYNSQKLETLSELAMENVEALADDEIIIGPWYCAGSGYCFDTETTTTWDGTKYYM